jgi:hypothetical protein
MFIKNFKRKYNLGLKLEVLGAVAQLAFVCFVVLSRLDIPHLDFFEGILLGVSIAGNLAWLVHIRKKREE